MRSYERNGAATVELDDAALIPDLVFELAGAGVRVTRVEPHVPTLEDLYFAVLGDGGATSEGRAT